MSNQNSQTNWRKIIFVISFIIFIVLLIMYYTDFWIFDKGPNIVDPRTMEEVNNVNSWNVMDSDNPFKGYDDMDNTVKELVNRIYQ